MPSKEDYRAMHEDAVKLLQAIEEIAPVAKRMAAFSASFLGQDEEQEETRGGSSDKEDRKKMMVLKLRKLDAA